MRLSKIIKNGPLSYEILQDFQLNLSHPPYKRGVGVVRTQRHKVSLFHPIITITVLEQLNYIRAGESMSLFQPRLNEPLFLNIVVLFGESSPNFQEEHRCWKYCSLRQDFRMQM